LGGEISAEREAFVSLINAEDDFACAIFSFSSMMRTFAASIFLSISSSKSDHCALPIDPMTLRKIISVCSFASEAAVSILIELGSRIPRIDFNFGCCFV
jgi:hypothetical protein